MLISKAGNISMLGFPPWTEKGENYRISPRYQSSVTPVQDLAIHGC